MPAPVMVVTGASRGIGAATARLAAERGYAVCINYRRERATGEALASEIEAAGGRAIAVAADVASEPEVARLFATVDERLGRLAVLVNNAGILAPTARVEDMDAERLARVLATNVIGCFLCAREAVRRMSTRHGGAGGAIVNVSSAAARLGAPGEFVDYAASKGALDTFTAGLAKEVGGEGIRVNAVRPGLIHTDIHASAGDAERVERLGATVPMRRAGHPLEVARAILWLAGEESGYTTGTFIEVSGGR